MKVRTVDFVLFILILTQTAISLAFPIYLDKGWIKETWFGNDIVTLILVCPLLLLCIFSKKKVFKLINIGCLGYLIYNYAFYLLGTELNKMFILYAVIVGLASVLLIYILSTNNDHKNAFDYFDLSKKNILPAVIFLFIGIGLGLVWIVTWISYSYFGNQLQTETTAFRLIASLDLIFMVIPFIISGIGLLKKEKIGFIIGVITGIQGFFYLIILSTNSILMSFNDPKFINELPIWGTLLFIESAGIILLLMNGKKRILTTAST